MKLNQIFKFSLQKTFIRAKSWINELQEERPSTVIALAGNKTDLAAQRQVVFEVSTVYSLSTLSFWLPNLVHTFVLGIVFTCMYYYYS